MTVLLEHPGESSDHELTPEEKAAAHSRRTFLFKVALLLNAAVGAVLAVPIFGYLLGPAMKKTSSNGAWVNLGSVDDFPEGETRLADFKSPVASLGDGETAKLPAGCAVSPRSNFRSSQSTARISAVRFAGSRNPNFSCAPAMAAPITKTAPEPPGRPSADSLNTSTSLSGIHSVIHAGDMPTLATQASCGERRSRS